MPIIMRHAGRKREIIFEVVDRTTPNLGVACVDLVRAPGVQIRFRYVASFRNAVENRDHISDFFHSPSPVEFVGIL